MKNNDENLTELIKKHRLIAIMRHLPDDQIEPVFGALAEAGVQLIEIAMNTIGAIAQLEKMLMLFGDRMMIGAGTVLSPELAKEAIETGARFMITPHFDPEVVAVARTNHCPIIPGVLTPTEMMTARKAGVDVLKLFPADQMGTAYIRNLLAPFKDLNLVAVGGIKPDNALDWIKAGCIGVGIGTALFEKTWLETGRYSEITEQVRRLIDQLTR